MSYAEQEAQGLILSKKLRDLEDGEAKMTAALQWFREYFLSRDRMNARIHCAPLRLPPITEMVLMGLGEEFPKE